MAKVSVETETVSNSVVSNAGNLEPVLLSDYDYELPQERIAQTPVEPRDSARLLVVPRMSHGAGSLQHRIFRELPELLHPNDLLVVNETRVSAIRLFGERPGGGAIEVLLLRPAIEFGETAYSALVRPGRRVREGDLLPFPDAGLVAEVLSPTPEGGRILRFASQEHSSGEFTEETLIRVMERLEQAGRVPLPPYITEPLRNKERYQTVYARVPGSAAAPTAGLHFTPELLDCITAMGVQIARIQLDVGLGTFRPIRENDVRHHEMHAETVVVSDAAAEAVNGCTGRVIAVGTTTLRALETAAEQAQKQGKTERVCAFRGETRLFVYPGFVFGAVDALITNFHQPHSSLLLLVAAFAGKEQMQVAYQTALAEGYRFLSFGDAMFISSAFE
jgi:S-adenosylmethionine:tRNA ribosyltransferase-isomerase